MGHLTQDCRVDVEVTLVRAVEVLLGLGLESIFLTLNVIVVHWIGHYDLLRFQLRWLVASSKLRFNDIYILDLRFLA